ncbi:hypothetical protein GGX14DRAFT_405942 [Mycena pura]|uniref:Uncharacterized protein n=1 Tax=Mycena pura TaxID=153505 RepID=A0AAD6UYA5_9AGAR|nr:hypothetical protein GGX14DRAFT_405942 [Mycena pura]
MLPTYLSTSTTQPPDEKPRPRCAERLCVLMRHCDEHSSHWVAACARTGTCHHLTAPPPATAPSRPPISPGGGAMPIVAGGAAQWAARRNGRGGDSMMGRGQWRSGGQRHNGRRGGAQWAGGGRRNVREAGGAVWTVGSALPIVAGGGAGWRRQRSTMGSGTMGAGQRDGQRATDNLIPR